MRSCLRTRGNGHTAVLATGDKLSDIEALIGSDHNDTLHGKNGVDFTGDGGAGADKLRGFNGSDTLNGGTGNDEMWGGTGADTFIFEADTGTDTIWDFEDGIDLIDLSAFGDVSSTADLTITTASGFVEISGFGDNGETIRLFGIDPADIGDDDFIFG